MKIDGIRQIDWLKEAFGDAVHLTEGANESEPYRIMAEFMADGKPYAVLQSAAMRKEDEFALFKLSRTGDSIELETIDDEEEWELVAEIYDDMFYP